MPAFGGTPDENLRADRTVGKVENDPKQSFRVCCVLLSPHREEFRLMSDGLLSLRDDAFDRGLWNRNPDGKNVLLTYNKCPVPWPLRVCH